MTEAEQQALEFVRQRKAAYQLAFGSPAGVQVLADLEPFCRGSRSAFHPDPRIHAALEGRREVWLRIREHIDLPAEHLFELYTQRKLTPESADA